MAIYSGERTVLSETSYHVNHEPFPIIILIIFTSLALIEVDGAKVECSAMVIRYPEKEYLEQVEKIANHLFNTVGSEVQELSTHGIIIVKASFVAYDKNYYITIVQQIFCNNVSTLVSAQTALVHPLVQRLFHEFVNH